MNTFYVLCVSYLGNSIELVEVKDLTEKEIKDNARIGYSPCVLLKSCSKTEVPFVEYADIESVDYAGRFEGYSNTCFRISEAEKERLEKLNDLRANEGYESKFYVFKFSIVDVNSINLVKRREGADPNDEGFLVSLEEIKTPFIRNPHVDLPRLCYAGSLNLSVSSSGSNNCFFINKNEKNMLVELNKQRADESQ